MDGSLSRLGGFGRSSLDEVAREHDALKALARFLGVGEQKSSRDASGFLERLTHSGELQRLSERAVVEPGERDVVRSLPTLLSEPGKHPGRELIVARKHGCHFSADARGRGARPVDRGVHALDDCELLEPTRFVECTFEPRESQHPRRDVLQRFLGFVNERHPFVSAVHKMSTDEVSAALIVEEHARELVFVGVNKHDGWSPLLKVLDPVSREGKAHDDDPV